MQNDKRTKIDRLMSEVKAEIILAETSDISDDQLNTVYLIAGEYLENLTSVLIDLRKRNKI